MADLARGCPDPGHRPASSPEKHRGKVAVVEGWEGEREVVGRGRGGRHAFGPPPHAGGRRRRLEGGLGAPSVVAPESP
jgi:hypothetical protein